MWDVNLTHTAQLRFQQKRFDLNYVGCERSVPFRYTLSIFITVWSELCGMWTWQGFYHCRFFTWRFDLNYVGCEHGLIAIIAILVIVFDLNYVGCEPIESFNSPWYCMFFVWSELCGMWTHYNHNNNDDTYNVWSELCGMWTWFDRYNCDFGYRVWSELCGMWTLSFAEVW